MMTIHEIQMKLGPRYLSSTEHTDSHSGPQIPLFAFNLAPETSDSIEIYGTPYNMDGSPCTKKRLNTLKILHPKPKT